MEGCTVVDDYCDKFKDIDGNEVAVLIVRLEEEGATFDFFWKIDVPPEAKFDGISTGSFQAAVAKRRCGWCPEYDMGNWRFPYDSGVWMQFFTEELNLLAH